MTFTYTGRSVKPGGNVAPSLTDIAVGLSRQPRFAGQGRRWFSVLDHSLFAQEIARQEDRSDELQLALLLHDAHEAITGDVPSPWKDGMLRLRQQDLDIIIMNAYFPGGYGAYAALLPMVKLFDRRALVAEARVVGPDVPGELLLDAFGITDTVLDDVAILEGDLAYDASRGVPPTVYDASHHPAVQAFLQLYLELR